MPTPPLSFSHTLTVRLRIENKPDTFAKILHAIARAIASCISSKQPSAEYIIPGIFNMEVPRRVAGAVEEAAHMSRAARKRVAEGTPD